VVKMKSLHHLEASPVSVARAQGLPGYGNDVRIKTIAQIGSRTGRRRYDADPPNASVFFAFGVSRMHSLRIA
jgi:hypothetical protein